MKMMWSLLFGLQITKKYFITFKKVLVFNHFIDVFSNTKM